jgi:hypothetical protein
MIGRSWTMGASVAIGQTNHNGGESQTNFGGNSYIQFIDVVKQANNFTYVGTPTDANAPPIPLLELDANGYPTTLVAGVEGVQFYYPLFRVAEYSGVWVVVWKGAGTLGLGGNVAAAAGYSNPSSITSATDAGGRFEFTRTADQLQPAVTIAATATSGAGTHIRDMHIFRKIDETQFNAGRITSLPFASRLLDLGPGCARNLGWLGDFSNLNGANFTNLATWAQRKPTSYFGYAADQFIPSQWVGTLTWTGNCATVSAQGFTLADKKQVHAKFTSKPATEVGGVLRCDISSGASGQITKANHGQIVGNALVIQYAKEVTFLGTTNGSPNVELTNDGTTANIAVGQEVFSDNFPSGTTVISITDATHMVLSSGATVTTGAGVFTRMGLPAPLKPGIIYWVVGVPTANTMTISATRGGSPVNITGGAISNVIFSPLWMVDIGGTGYYPMWDTFPVTGDSAFLGYYTPKPGYVTTLTFDEVCQCWRRHGGDDNLGHRGIIGGVPPETFIDACIELGMQPWLVMPPLSHYVAGNVHACSDFVDGYIGYARTKQLSTAPWLKPVIECLNECWNLQIAFQGTYVARSYAWAVWGTVDSYHDKFYGRAVSVVGQKASSTFGNDRTRYSMVCSFQTTGFHDAQSRGIFPLFDERSQGLTYQVLNSGSPAHLWTDRFCGAPYYAPSEYKTIAMADRALDAIITNHGNPTGRMSVVEAYCATALDGSSDTEYTVPYVDNCFANMKTYALQMPVGNTIEGIVGYEGAWSPDYINPMYNYPTGATNASTCTLTVPVVVPPDGNFPLGITNMPPAGYVNGLPNCAGMAVTPEACAGIDELNLKGGIGISFTGGGSPDIITNEANGFWVGATVWPYTNDGAGLPPELTYGARYFVVFKSGTTIRISVTKGGAAINFSSTGSTAPGVGRSLSFAYENFVTFTGGGSANIAVDTGAGYPDCFFSVDDVVVPGNGNGVFLPLYDNLPPEIAAGKAYYVVARPTNTTFHISATKGGSPITFASAFNTTQTSFRRGWKVLSVDRASRQFTIDRNTTGLGTFTSGVFEWTYSNMMINSMLYATKSANNVGVANDQMYGIWTSKHNPPAFVMEWPSNFILFGSGTVWSVLDPGIFAPDTPQSLSIKAYN